MDNVTLTDDKEFNHEIGMENYRDTSKDYESEFMPKIWKEITQEEIDAGHGGMDTLMLRAFFDAILKDEEMPIDVYDAASWMSITCLSEASVSKGGLPMDIPDFTGGRWLMREPKDIIDLN